MFLEQMQVEVGGISSMRAADEVYPGLLAVVTIVHLRQAVDLNCDFEDSLGFT